MTVRQSRQLLFQAAKQDSEVEINVCVDFVQASNVQMAVTVENNNQNARLMLTCSLK